MSVKVGNAIYVRGVGEVIVNEILPDGCPVYEDDAGANVYAEYGDYEIITNEEGDSMKAEKGDLIRVVNAEDLEKRYKNGTIFEVYSRFHNGVWTTTDVDIHDTEYVIHRKAGEEDSTEQVANERFIEELSKAYAEETLVDAVNQPSHYTQGKFETIEVIEHLTSKYDDGFTAHCVGTAFKYMDRAPYKHEEPTECLRKAAKYLEFAIERLDAKSTQE